MTDLTKITAPFGLLDAETQMALRSTGETIEKYAPYGWSADDDPAWVPHIVYRVKPQSPKPREWWFNTYHKSRAVVLYASREEADNAMCMDRIECIHVVEKLP